MRLFKFFILIIFVLIIFTVPKDIFSQAEIRNLSIIVIDPGYGGKDTGPVSCKKSIYAKDINLQIAEKLAKRIENTLNVKTILTRNVDQSLSLVKRVAMANNSQADFLISIHTNAHKNSKAQGIETYHLNIADGEDSIKVSISDDSHSGRKNMDSNLSVIMLDLLGIQRIKESAKLARHIHGSIIENVSVQYPDVIDRGVKKAPFYVLIGSLAPAVLIETGFITNPLECRRLISIHYQELLCEGIVRGIQAYMKNQ